ncbi:MAG TPA: vanadium-dependent haloperoxidase [Gemmatimonadaceae bacterium]|nr:vanadium-dependent haloperoxidase [Gemmatimonadaceae bacterium]
MQNAHTARVRRARALRRASAALLGAASISLAVAGCVDPSTGPDPDATLRPVTHNVGGVAATAVPRWAAIARGLVIKNRPSPPAAFRQFAYLSVAQYAAVVAAERDWGHPRPSVEGAVAGASAAVLAHLFPGDAQAVEDSVRAGEPDAPGDLRRFAAGEALGREVAAAVVARAAGDGFNLVFTGTIPTGSGLWFSSATPPAAPQLPRLGEMRPFFLSSGSQLRPPPPPAFGSPAFLAALAEIRDIAATRTAEQTRIAQFWALPAGTVLPAGYWNQTALEIIARKQLGERRAARVLALMHAAMIDAVITTHQAKYTYWYIRPTQADPTITLAIGLPNHPSYPSNHSSASSAAGAVLGAFFPSERERLDAMVEEASLSRMYGGLHYRFDVEAGHDIGSAAARIALRRGRGNGLLEVAR